MEHALRKLQGRLQNNWKLKKSGDGSKFFGCTKRGEVAELSQDLGGNDKEKQKNAVKRIIASMTLGKDVSSLFADVVKLGQTHSVELKKLVYLYILNTAKMQPEKALMAVSTFLRDANHESPIIRALAIRTMMCIRVDCIVEYVLDPLRQSVRDSDPYVRKTAAFGLGKLYHNNSRIFLEHHFMEDLFYLIDDSFPVVSSSACIVLHEIWCSGGVPPESLSSAQVMKLINGMPEATEWGQSFILEVLSSCADLSAAEAHTLVERTIPRLGHTNASVVLSAVKLIVNLLPKANNSELERVCINRVNSAILTLIKSDPEIQYITCKNVNMLITLYPAILRNNLGNFFIRFSDPFYVKKEKLSLLLRLVTSDTALAVMKELMEYSAEVDLLFVKEVVAAFATLSLKISDVAPQCAEFLLTLADSRPELIPHIVNASKDIVRKHHELLILGTLIRDHEADQVNEEDAKVSFVWMLGEFCDFIEDGPYHMQGFLDSLLLQEPSVQLAILTAVLKLFLRNPEKMEMSLNSVLDILTQKSKDPDIRDRAYTYKRLLAKGVGTDAMRRIVHGCRSPISINNGYADSMTPTDLRQSLNTSAAVFGKSKSTFTNPYFISSVTDNDYDDDEDELLSISGDVDSEVQHQYKDPNGNVSAPVLMSEKSETKSLSKKASGLDDLFGPTPVRSDESPMFKVYQDAHLLVEASLDMKAKFLSLKLTNVGSSPISEFALQINRSLVGATPACPLHQVMKSSSLVKGQSEVVDLPISCAASHLNPHRDANIEVGLKTIAGLCRFHVPIALHQLLADAPKIDQFSFNGTWQSLEERCEKRISLSNLSQALLSEGPQNVCSKLNQHSMQVVESVAKPSQHAYHGSFKTHMGVTALFEIMVFTDVSRESYMICKSVSIGDVSGCVEKLLMALFSQQQSTNLNINQSKGAMSVDDLFS
eukprot:Tbor_TRINITY_DN114_c0_g1::TRINITY_DN114_c0_g1_i1::g.11982::m.11982/K12392/AP1B1; AP-1 complex subunit beta-1